MIAAMLAALISAAAQPAASADGAATAASAAPAKEVRSRKKSGKPPMVGVVNVNRASEAELRLLPGIGKRRAQLIVERRDKKPFARVDEIGRISGMRSLVQRLRKHLSVQGDTTIHPVRP
jgi:DNA uptake protein ComE-like DNA-binding protein